MSTRRNCCTENRALKSHLHNISHWIIMIFWIVNVNHISYHVQNFSKIPWCHWVQNGTKSWINRMHRFLDAAGAIYYICCINPSMHLFYIPQCSIFVTEIRTCLHICYKLVHHGIFVWCAMICERSYFIRICGRKCIVSWWRHQMEIFSALLAFCAENSLVTGEFPTQRPVTRSFDVFFDLRLNKRLGKQSWDSWFETPWCPLWRTQ